MYVCVCVWFNMFQSVSMLEHLVPSTKALFQSLYGRVHVLLHGDRRIACWAGLRDEAWKRLDQSFWTHGLELLKVLGI